MTILILHLVSCAFMTGLIWVIQVLHYPTFSLIENNKFSYFHERHSRVITFIVAPVMLFELATGFFLIYKNLDSTLLITNLFMLILIWLSTALLSVPLHNKLAKAQNQTLIQKLVITNWPRTVLWSLRLILLINFTQTQIGVQIVELK